MIPRKKLSAITCLFVFFTLFAANSHAEGNAINIISSDEFSGTSYVVASVAVEDFKKTISDIENYNILVIETDSHYSVMFHRKRLAGPRNDGKTSLPYGVRVEKMTLKILESDFFR